MSNWKEEGAAAKPSRIGFITTLLSIALVLAVIGLFGLQLIIARQAARQLKSDFTLRIELSDAANDSIAAGIVAQLAQNPKVLKVHYISKDAGAQEFTPVLGEDFVSYLGYNPLPAIVEVNFKPEFAQAHLLEQFTEDVKAMPFVSTASFPEKDLNRINRNVQRISIWLLALGGILIFIAINLINNAIRLAIYAKRLLIKTMLLVGATRAFIRRPFLWSAFWQGLWASLLALCFIAGLYWAMERQIPELIELRNIPLLGLLAAGILAFGVLLSSFCTFFALGKYLRSASDQLF